MDHVLLIALLLEGFQPGNLPEACVLAAVWRDV